MRKNSSTWHAFIFSLPQAPFFRAKTINLTNLTNWENCQNTHTNISGFVVFVITTTYNASVWPSVYHCHMNNNHTALQQLTANLWNKHHKHQVQQQLWCLCSHNEEEPVCGHLVSLRSGPNKRWYMSGCKYKATLLLLSFSSKKVAGVSNQSTNHTVSHTVCTLLIFKTTYCNNESSDALDFTPLLVWKYIYMF